MPPTWCLTLTITIKASSTKRGTLYLHCRKNLLLGGKTDEVDAGAGASGVVPQKWPPNIAANA